MPPGTEDNNTGGTTNQSSFTTGDQHAEKIVNLGTNVGDINIQSATIVMNAINDKKPQSMLLTRKLTEAIKNYSPRANNFLSKIKESEKADWESRSDNKYLSTAKGVVVSSYASVLSVYISNLFGCENAKDYFALSIATTKRALQIICFAFISSLWEYLKDDQTKLKGKQPAVLIDLFNAQTEPDIADYVQLMIALVTMFEQEQITYPIPEIKNIQDDLKDGSTFLAACKKMNEFAVRSNNGLPSVDEIENVLTTFLVTFNFLAAYKMISVKDISYEEVWYKDIVNDEVKYRNSSEYLHSYTLLGMNNEKNGRRYNYDASPLKTEAVLLYKDRYQDGISLFPFIIDFNTLIDEMQVNICFYTSNEKIIDADDKALQIVRYFDSNKTSSGNEDTDIIIQFDEDIEAALAVKPNNDIITKFKTEDNSNKFKAKKKNEVFKAFNQVRTIIIKNDI